MATKSEESTNPVATDSLNKLLDNALDDLLLDDVDDDATADSAKLESEGRPNIEESLKKITALGKSEEKKQKAAKAGEVVAEPPGPSAAGASGEQPPSVVDMDEMNRFFASMTEKLKTELPPMDPQEAQIKLSESVPEIFNLMQNLLSRELLYPALRDLEPKFKEFLEKRLATLDKEDRRRYQKQMGKIREIIDVFDDESLDDQERFEKNLELMEQMQSYGAPPEELTVPDGMSKCSIM